MNSLIKSLKFVPKAKAFAHPTNQSIKIDLHIPSLIEFIDQHVKSDCDWINIGIKPLSQPTHDGRTHCVFLWDSRYRIPTNTSTEL